MNRIDLSAAAGRVASSLTRVSTTGTLASRGLVSSKFQAYPAKTPSTATTPTTGTESSTASLVTANDFLTLLVTEMKNQDPTQPTDPNAYIQQLVSVNSLQQLIAINHDLTPPAATPVKATP